MPKELPDGFFWKRGKIWVSVWVDGKRKRRPTRTDDMLEAIRIAERMKLEAKVPTVEAFAVEYTKANRHQRSWKSFKSVMLKRLILEIGHLSLSQITPKVVEQYQTKRLGDGRRPATVNRELAVLMHMLSTAVRWEIIDHIVMKRAKEVKPLAEENERLRYLSTEEAARLVKEAAPHLKVLFIVALNTGMRKGELLELDWERVDLRNRRIILHRTKAKRSRYVRMNDTAAKALQSIPRPLHGGRVFLYRGKPIKEVKTAVHTALKKAGLDGVCFHTLRHTFASHLALAGAHAQAIQNSLGHTTPRMTARYTHLAESYVDQFLSGLYQDDAKESPEVARGTK